MIVIMISSEGIVIEIQGKDCFYMNLLTFINEKASSSDFIAS